MSWKLSRTVLRGPDGSNPVWLLDKRSGRSKQPYYFQMQDESPFAFAGIWDNWQSGDVSITSCAIITTAPNELLAPIHNRMPVILNNEAQERWLRDNVKPEELQELLVRFPRI